MEDSPIGLDKWLTAMWLIAGAKNGSSSYEIHRSLGITQKSAWFLLHRIRLAMQQGSLENSGPFSGTVEVDETFISGKAKNMHAWKCKLKIQGHGATGKTIVLGLLERGEKDETTKKTLKPSRARVKVIPNTKRETLQAEVRAHVLPGSEVFTDAASGYVGLTGDYIHEAIDHAERRGFTNGMENYWTLLDRCLAGTYVSLEAAHLPAYLDEQAFRFNERKDNDAGRFRKTAEGMDGKRLTCEELIAQDDPEMSAKPRRGRPRKVRPERKL